MLSRDKILKETSPFSIFFVKSGSSGNRLLFRYPYDDNFQDDPDLKVLDGQPSVSEQDRLQLLSVIGENDEALCNMFSVNPNLCGQKFEIKISSVRHVGHPMSLLPNNSSATNQSQATANLIPATKASTASLPANTTLMAASNQPLKIQAHHHNQVNLSLSSYDCLTAPNRHYSINQGDTTSFNIVCALRSSASYDIVNCYHDLTKRLAIALSFEEHRCSYLSKEIKTMMAALEERDMANLAERDQQSTRIQASEKGIINSMDYDNQEDVRNTESVFNVILNRSQLARDLKKVFISLSTTGVVDLKINNWVSVSFCLPQKVHRLKLMTHKSMPTISTRDLKRCLLYLRPYHGLLLLQDPQELLDSLPIDASPAFIQLIRVTKPDKNFMDLSVDANLTLMQIFSIVSQLIYWAKATVIYPVCDSNIYAIHPLASTGTQSKLVDDFKARFPSSKSIHHYLADFSEGTSLSQLNGPLLNIDEKLNLLNIVTWLLQRRVLIQIHKYIFLVVDKGKSGDKFDSASKFKANPPRATNGVSDNLGLSPQGIEIHAPNSYGSSIQNNTGPGSQNQQRQNGVKLQANNSLDSSSPQIFKNSYSESLESSFRRYRADSLPESQEDSNFGLNSSLSSTPNSNLDYPSPSNDPNIRSSLSSSCPLDNPLNSISGSETVLTALQRAGLSQSGIENVLAVPSSRNPDDLRLFLHLIPYFDGKHHIEDIMFFENLERSQVLILCDKFRDILLTCHYEDVAVSQLSPSTFTR